MLCSTQEFDNIELTIDEYVNSQAADRHKKIFDSFQICPQFVESGSCPKRDSPTDPCPHRHSRGEKSIVCKHWLRGLCKKEEDCEFLHMYDMTKLPPCHFFSTFGKCNNPECLFLHLRLNLGINMNCNKIIDESMNENKIHRECQWYKHGYCPLGDKECTNQHIKRIICPDWLNGACMNGELNCPFEHPRFELPTTKLVQQYMKNPHSFRNNQRNRDRNNAPTRTSYVNNNSNNNVSSNNASSSMSNINMPMPANTNNTVQSSSSSNDISMRDMNSSNNSNNNNRNSQSGSGATRKKLRPLNEVTCFKCGQRGHYANACNNAKVKPPAGGWTKTNST